MKSHGNSKDLQARQSSREEPRKSTATTVNFFKKLTKAIPMAVPTKSVLLNSHRGSKPKIDPIKIPQQSQQLSQNHSRYLLHHAAR